MGPLPLFFTAGAGYVLRLPMLGFTGYGRLPEMSAGKMTIEDWSRKEALCNDLLRVFDLTEGAQAIVKGEG